MSRQREPYNLALSFERALVTSLCRRPKLWARIGSHVEHECLAAAPAKLALQAAAAIAKDNGGHGPESLALVIQRLRRWMGEGKITQKAIEEVGDFFDEAEDYGTIGDDALITEMVPILKRRLERDSIDDAVAEFARKGDPTRALAKMEQAKKLGAAEDRIGTYIGPASFDQLVKLQRVERLKTGIMELDDGLDGGVMRGTETVYIAGTGGGKSVAMVQQTAASAVQGFNVAVATLELPTTVWSARLKACLTGIPINAIMADPLGCGAIEKMDEFQHSPAFGKINIKEFTPKSTTMGDLREWMKGLEDDLGRPIDVLVVDYADKMRARGLSDRAQENSYQSQGSVYEDLYVWARDERRWVFTGSQSTRNKDKGKGKTLDVDDVADSMGKVRTADLVLTLNLRDEFTQMVFKVAKNRLGRPGQTIGPLPCDFGCARIAPVDFFSLQLDPFAEAYGAVVALKTARIV